MSETELTRMLKGAANSGNPSAMKDACETAAMRLARADQPRPAVPRGWQPIETAPKDAHRILLLIPYDRKVHSELKCTDVGRWSNAYGCWRFFGDDGPHDLQPTHWKPLFAAQQPEGGG